MFSRKLALSLARQYRTCPPKEIREDASHGEELKKHIALCPYCSAQQPEGTDPWEKLASKLQDIYSSLSAPAIDERIIEGQLRPVMPSLGKWREGHFYNPPLVLVVSKIGSISDDVLVAQTYHDIYLAGPGDLILTEEISSSGSFFVESWNTYTLKTASLDPALERFPHEIVEAARTLEKDHDAYPDWAMRPRPFSQNDARIYFRRLEVEVGYTFSAPAVEELMMEFEGGRRKLVYSSNEELRQAIIGSVPGIYWPGEPRDPEELLALAHFPPEQLRLAASETDQMKLTANLVVVEFGRIKSFEPVPMIIFTREMDAPDHLTVDGRILEIPARFKESEFLCFLLPEKGEPGEPSESHWDENTGSFLVSFERARDVEGRLEVAVVFTLNGD